MVTAWKNFKFNDAEKCGSETSDLTITVGGERRQSHGLSGPLGALGISWIRCCWRFDSGQTSTRIRYGLQQHR